MKKIIVIITFLIIHNIGFSQTIFKSSKDKIVITVNNVKETDWTLAPEVNPDIYDVPCTKRKNKVTFFDGKDSISFNVSKGQIINFVIITPKNEKAYTRLVGKEPNITLSKRFIKENRDKIKVEIPEVSELVNIIMALHKDATKDYGMFDTKSDYYRKIKDYFAPYQNHPAIDTIQKYISGLHYIDSTYMGFSMEGNWYYYKLKMNACAYEFDKNDKIKNQGNIKEIAIGWGGVPFDPMKDKAIFEDFARKSNFRKFYSENKPYYDELIKTYNQLNPIRQMQSWLNNKFGALNGSYFIYFSPLVYGSHSTAGFNINDYDLTMMFICKATNDTARSLNQNILRESRVVFTEIDHNYVNPMTDNYKEKVNNSFSNREIWAKGNITDAYPNTISVFNEYMTWGLFTLYVFDNYSKKDVEEFLPKMEKQMVEKRGYIKFKEFNRTLLEKYQQNPNIKMTDLYEFILTWAENENK